MRFGGHQTFAIRDGWMFKGLQVLIEEPELLGSDSLRDHLGVGKNMAKSIQHWLLATALAQRSGASRAAKYQPSDLARLIWNYDRYLLHPGTWWVIHSSLALNDSDAYSWNWFFNHFSNSKFERAVALDGLRRHLLAEGSRMPSMQTLDRDLACLLKSYAESLPRDLSDPEENLECPLVALGLVTHSRQTGVYTLNRELKPIPFTIFGWIVGKTFSTSDEATTIDISLSELTHEVDSPGRIFALTAEALFDLCVGFSSQQPERLSVSSQAGERVIRLQTQPENDWLEEYFSGLPQGESAQNPMRVA